eukprot:c13299_g2_i1.p1 GENE.c13299_g2_i1~~c13299_g2_i1.p1  ORF type:complete len:262 (-),score=100.00 c13299_g2_i1:27-812(-)
MKNPALFEPSEKYLTTYLSILTLCGFTACFFLRTLRPRGLRAVLHDLGVTIEKCARTAKEINRKTFHICGLLIPFLYQVFLHFGLEWYDITKLCWTLTILGWSIDLLRLYSPSFANSLPLFFRSILREKEQNKLSGACFFSLGCTLTITFFPPSVAMTSILFLVLGDLAAAMIGISIGGDTCVKKIGREGKKSLEGSVAMFIVCFMTGCSIFAEVHLSEYAVFFGSLAATLTELYEPFGLDDNLTIPFVSGVALMWGFNRI